MSIKTPKSINFVENDSASFEDSNELPNKLKNKKLNKAEKNKYFYLSFLLIAISISVGAFGTIAVQKLSRKEPLLGDNGNAFNPHPYIQEGDFSNSELVNSLATLRQDFEKFKKEIEEELKAAVSNQEQKQNKISDYLTSKLLDLHKNVNKIIGDNNKNFNSFISKLIKEGTLSQQPQEGKPAETKKEEKKVPPKELSQESVIMDKDDEKMIKDAIKQRLGRAITGITKVYDAKVNGDTASNFHSICDDYHHTIVLIKTAGNNRFGGFTTRSWADAEGNWVYKEDKNAFVFNLNAKKIYKIKEEASNAILCNKKYGPVFGLGNDILVGDQFLGKSTSYTTTTGSYVSYEGEGYTFGEDDNGKKFEIAQLEVYTVIFEEA